MKWVPRYDTSGHLHAMIYTPINIKCRMIYTPSVFTIGCLVFSRAELERSWYELLLVQLKLVALLYELLQVDLN